MYKILYNPREPGQALALAGLPPGQQAEVWQEAVERFEQPTAKQITAVRDALVTPSKAAMFTSESQQWNTPRPILDAAIAVLGAIDLDPCCNAGMPNVPATAHYREEDDGLQRPWQGRLYVNPPYDTTAAWVGKLAASHQQGAVSAAVLLVAARTDTHWFQVLTPYPVCFVRGRLKFSGAENSAPFPSAVFYLGPDTRAFAAVFNTLGPIYEVHRGT